MGYRQADKLWSREIIGTGPATMGLAGCVVTSAAVLREHLLGKTMTPLEVLRLLRKTPGAFVDVTGRKPGTLMSWPIACTALGMICDVAVSSEIDDEEMRHEFAGKLVDENANLAGTLAAALIDGAAAVRVSTDATLKGRHTIACLGRDDSGNFVCHDPATGNLIPLDANLENPEVMWGSKVKQYRATSIRAVRKA